MRNKNEIDMSLVPEQQSGRAIDAESTIELNNEKIAVVFFEVVKNRLQHVNSWSIIADGLSAEFQLVNKEGIEIYRKAQEGDLIKIDIPGPGSKSGRGFDWVRIEALESVSDNDGVESFGFRVRPTENPLNHRNGSYSSYENSVNEVDTAHFYGEESTSTFMVSRIGNKVTAAIYDRNAKINASATHPIDRLRNGLIAAAALVRFSHVQWKNLTDGLLSR